jgi:hypothetical protein
MNVSWNATRKIEAVAGAGTGAEREQESDYESAEEEPPTERTKGLRRGPSVEESWSEDWDEEVMAGEVPLRRLGAGLQVSGGGYSALSGDDSEEFDGGEEEELVFNVRAQTGASSEQGGRAAKHWQTQERKQHQKQEQQSSTPSQQEQQQQQQGEAGVKFAPVVGQDEIQSWARQLAGTDGQEGRVMRGTTDDKDEKKRAASARRERRLRMWERDPFDWWHTEWARAEVVQRLAGCMVGAGEIVRCRALLQRWKRGGQEGQHAERKRRKSVVEELTGEGKMRHKPG